MHRSPENPHRTADTPPLTLQGYLSLLELEGEVFPDGNGPLAGCLDPKTVTQLLLYGEADGATEPSLTMEDLDAINPATAFILGDTEAGRRLIHQLTVLRDDLPKEGAAWRRVQAKIILVEQRIVVGELGLI